MSTNQLGRALAVSIFLTLFTVSSAAVAVDTSNGFTQPAEVIPGKKVSSQLVNVKIGGMSLDGDTDIVYFEFPDFLEQRISPNNVNANVSISSSKEIIDYDGDGVMETVKVGFSQDGEGNTTANVTLDTTVEYPDNFSTVEVNVWVQDSRGGAASGTLQISNANESETTDSGDSTNGNDSTDTDNTDDTESSDSAEQNQNDAQEDTTGDSDSTETRNQTAQEQQNETQEDQGQQNQQRQESAPGNQQNRPEQPQEDRGQQRDKVEKPGKNVLIPEPAQDVLQNVVNTLQNLL